MKALLTEGHTSDFMLLPLPRRVVCVNASWTVLSVLRWNECYSTESLGKYCSLGGHCEGGHLWAALPLCFT